ncbi:hypothetical protein ACOT1K_14285 [Providencia manganoxydans]|uniref:hypothetical protein n=1 Tax=Providencia TaxID=586 RepID=UPI0011226A14|nr:hypothetical protein [Providencia stuartii]
MKIKCYIPPFSKLPFFVFFITINTIFSANAEVYFSSQVESGSSIKIVNNGGFFGPIPKMTYSGLCLNVHSYPRELMSCAAGEGSLHSNSSFAKVGCLADTIVTSMRNKTTGRPLIDSNSGWALKVGQSAFSQSNLFGYAYVGTHNPSWRDVLCSSNQGNTMSASPNSALHYLYTEQGFNLGDTIELCIVEQFIDIRGSGGYYDGPYNTKGASYCTTVDTVASACEITGDLNIDLGSIGIGRSAYSEASAMLSCPTTSSVTISMVKQNMEGTIPLRNNRGNAIEAKIRMQVGKNAKSTEWSGIVKESIPLLFSADINNVGYAAGEFSGQTIIILNNN